MMPMLEEMPVAILAGGLATRLGPLAEHLPKSLIPIAGRPFLEHQLLNLQKQGVRRVVLCVGHLGEMVEEFASDGREFGLEIRYAWDRHAPLGTGGALQSALPLLGKHFFCLYGDSFLDIDFEAVHNAFFRARKPALMTIFRNCGSWDRSNVLFENDRIVRYSKTRLLPEMAHIDYGLSVLSQAAFETVATREVFDLAEFLEKLADKEALAAYEATERFYEIGSVRGISELEAFLSAPESTLLPKS